jgi:hypothetical protein
MLLENICSPSITHDDCLVMIVICLCLSLNLGSRDRDGKRDKRSTVLALTKSRQG